VDGRVRLISLAESKHGKAVITRDVMAKNSLFFFAGLRVVDTLLITLPARKPPQQGCDDIYETM